MWLIATILINVALENSVILGRYFSSQLLHPQNKEVQKVSLHDLFYFLALKFCLYFFTWRKKKVIFWKLWCEAGWIREKRISTNLVTVIYSERIWTKKVECHSVNYSLILEEAWALVNLVLTDLGNIDLRKHTFCGGYKSYCILNLMSCIYYFLRNFLNVLFKVLPTVAIQ